MQHINATIVDHRSSSARRIGAGLRPRGWLIPALTALMVLAGCATRPGPETLLPVANLPDRTANLTVLTATNRALATTNPPNYGSERSAMSYEAYNLRVARPAGEANALIAPEIKVVERLRFGRPAFLQKLDQMQRGRDKTIILFVHGYNNTYQEAIFRLAGMAAESGVQAVPVVFSWPSAASVTGYVADRDSSTFARDDLTALLVDLTAGNPDSNVMVVGHSMGGWLVMEALRELRQTGRNDVISHLQVGLASPDIDLDVFRKQIDDVGRLTPPLTVLVSPDDRALAASARVSGGRTRLGALDVGDPKVQAMAEQAGVRLVDISALPANGRANHDRFLALATLRSPATRDNPLQELRSTGAYVLGSAGRILEYGVR